MPAPQGHCPRPWCARPSPHGLCQPAAVSAGVQIKPKEKGQEGEGTALGEAAQLGLGLVCCPHPRSALPAGEEQPQAEAAVPHAVGFIASRPRREKRDQNTSVDEGS